MCEASVAAKSQSALEAYLTGDFAESSILFSDAAKSIEQLEAPDVNALMKLNLYAGLSFREIGDYASAYDSFEKARENALSLSKDDYAAKILAYMAEAARLNGEYDKSRGDYAVALSSGFIDNSKDRAALYYGLAEVFRLSGKYEDALNACTKSREISKKISAEKLKLSCDIVEGDFFRAKGDFAQSLKTFGTALDIARAKKYTDVAVAALNGLGLVSESLGRNDAARDRFEDALALSIRNEMFDSVPLIIDEIYALLPERGALSGRGDKFSKMAQDFEPLMESDIKISLLSIAAAYYRISNDYSKMLTSAENIYNEAAATDNDEAASSGLFAMAEAFYGLEQYDNALDKIDEAQAYAEDAKSTDAIGRMFALKSKCFVKKGSRAEAIKAMQDAINSTSDEQEKAAHMAELSVLQKAQ